MLITIQDEKLLMFPETRPALVCCPNPESFFGPLAESALWKITKLGLTVIL